MRYSIINASIEDINKAGGRDIKSAPGTGILFADLDEAGVASLKSNGARVRSVENVKSDGVTPPVPIPVENGYSPLDLLAGIGFTDDFRHVIQPPLYGEGIALAILDSGIRESHELINGRVVYSKNFTSSPPGDAFNHGTGVASIVTAVAPQCDIIDIKVIGDNGLGTDEAVIMGIGEVINLKETRDDMLIYGINLSLGKEDDGDPDDPLRIACRAAIAKGLWIGAAAGNAGPLPSTIMSPASERYVIAVGSVSYNSASPEFSFLVSSFSSRGPTREGLVKPDIMLIGENVIMADSRSDTATIVKNGTSFAAPLASGIGILHYEGAMKKARRIDEFLIPDLPVEWVYTTPEDFIDRWASKLTVKPLSAPQGKDFDYGWGIPFGELAALALTGGAPLAVVGEITSMFVPVMGLGFMSMMMGNMAKAMR